MKLKIKTSLTLTQILELFSYSLLIILSTFLITKTTKLSCVDVKDKLYLLLGTLFFIFLLTREYWRTLNR